MLMKTMSKITSCQSVSSLRTEISHVLSHCHQALPSIQFKPLDFYLILTVLSGCQLSFCHTELICSLLKYSMGTLLLNFTNDLSFTWSTLFTTPTSHSVTGQIVFHPIWQEMGFISSEIPPSLPNSYQVSLLLQDPVLSHHYNYPCSRNVADLSVCPMTLSSLKWDSKYFLFESQCLSYFLPNSRGSKYF